MCVRVAQSVGYFHGIYFMCGVVIGVVVVAVESLCIGRGGAPVGFVVA
jgi:hypothetical protein